MAAQEPGVNFVATRWSRRVPVVLAAVAALALVLVIVVLAVIASREPPAPGLRVAHVVDPTGALTLDEVVRRESELQPFERARPMALGTGAWWLRVELPALDAARPWFLALNGAAFIDRASLFSPAEGGGWREQVAGDHVPVAQWTHPHYTPVFEVPRGGATTVWLRLQNRPAPASAHLQLLADAELDQRLHRTYLLIGAYLGFGLLVLLLALMHGRLYADVAFDSYAAYVACMLMFQLAFTGLGGAVLWPDSAAFNNAAPALFMFWMAGAGIWNVRKATALPRHGPRLDRAVRAFSFAGLLLPLPYLLLNDAAMYGVLNVYGLASVVLSISLCLWTWRRGEAYAGWLFLGFLPVHLAYPFPALRAAGVLPDSWATQYAVLIGSAIEIPLLLYILHRRAKDYSENHARLRAIDSTDPLTGLVAVPVLRLRLRDALRRGHRFGHGCAVLLVELANHAQIAEREGRNAADRALVVTASRLSGLVRPVDTVCRVSDTRFAVLVEGPCHEDERRRLAQHMVARGLDRLRNLPPDLELRLRVVSAGVPDVAAEASGSSEVEEQKLLQRLHRALDRLMRDPKRAIHHLQARVADGNA
jgi:diguanylate cyclase (GGDEF)-like protein